MNTARTRRWRVRVPRPEDFRSPAHAPAVAARLGLWLGVALAVCFGTGLLSHLAQHPPGWFGWPTRPVQLYRITQGLHVLSGVAAVPLLLAKLWSVYPRLFLRPPAVPARLLAHAAERVSILVLVCAAAFELVTGLVNVARWYPWRFFFPTAHYAVAWLAAGALLVHVGVKLPVVRAALGEPVRAVPGRRAVLGTAVLAAGAAVLATAGVTVPWLRRVAPLAWRSPAGPQGLPVNRTAAAAGVVVPADWRLEIRWDQARHALSLPELAALPQRTADLPIACVEGWSASARWTGVPVRDLLAAVGAPTDRPVRVASLEATGRYASSVLPAAHVADPLTLLALRLDGAVLHPDHGYPCRIIAPSRPGVLQTKWVTRLEVLP
ncbi:molybdopterin-dependent oxidoreductase [Micromonospora auratinigra]|uniref:Sulfoxide reductase catalytic subunit YedY n=1 Tax=Micromonospora auratinigra TaxID=261654 RepID=A0A1A9A9H8_9ACTN|nr:molybdopterin-dependent oxidoreductase [Micromonospora auratinigra]SBT52854.1 sulfoxide reductase catalytic subunit YedY [Micromonospora auratinigra]